MAAMRQLHAPRVLAITVDASLDLLTQSGARHKDGAGDGRGGRRGAGGGGGRHRAGPANSGENPFTWREIRQGDLSFVYRLINDALDRATRYLARRYPDLPDPALRDLALVLAVVLVVMGLKLLQILPGLPVAPGHKNLLIVPLLLYAARNTHMNFGGFWAGCCAGVVSFLLGYGKFGLLEISHFAAPGLLADVLIMTGVAASPALRFLQFAVYGAILGMTRFAANFLVKPRGTPRNKSHAPGPLGWGAASVKSSRNASPSHTAPARGDSRRLT